MHSLAHGPGNGILRDTLEHRQKPRHREGDDNRVLSVSYKQFLKAVMPQYLQFGLNFSFFINFLSLAFTFFTSSGIKYRHMINRASQRWLAIEVATTKHFGGAGARVYPTLSEILMQASKNTAHFLLTWPEGISPCPIPAIPIPRSLYARATLCFTRKSLAKRLESEP